MMVITQRQKEKLIISHGADPITTSRVELMLDDKPVFICCSDSSLMLVCFGSQAREWWAGFDNWAIANMKMKAVIPNEKFGFRVGSVDEPNYTVKGKRKIYEAIFG